MSQDLINCFDEGVQACIDGEPESSCNYPYGTKGEEAWLEGYRHEQSLAEDS